MCYNNKKVYLTNLINIDQIYIHNAIVLTGKMSYVINYWVCDRPATEI